ncbi:MAG: mobile mystery protein A [Cyanobacteria bacterium]|nr:mobile mystery protein A [Cyanobacteriota bacterium]
MKTARLAAQSRARLDERLAQFGPAELYRPPNRGWIKAIREGLGMSTAQLAKRLGVRQPSIVDLERSEEKGSIELATLRRVAEALDCDLVYALVPKQPLEMTIRARARALLRRRRSPVEHTMLLEAQHVAGPVTERQIDDIIRETSPRRFWD